MCDGDVATSCDPLGLGMIAGGVNCAAVGQLCVGGGCFDSECIPDCGGKECGNNGCGESCGSCPAGEFCNSDQICENANPCGDVDYIGYCSGNVLTYCHEPGQENFACSAPPDCVLEQNSCTTICQQSGHSYGTCTCGVEQLCMPGNGYCCYCSCD